jgi:cellulose biosynthesis protein BcsE
MSVTLIKGDPARQPILAIGFGTVCAIVAGVDTDPGRFVWNVLLTAMPTTPAWLLTTTPMPVVLEPPIAFMPAIAQARAKGQLNILRHQLARPSAKQLHRMLTEFDCFKIAPKSLLVIDCGDRWLGREAGPGQVGLIDLLQRWAQQHQVAVVLMFHSAIEHKIDRATALLSVACHLSGIARISREHANHQWPVVSAQSVDTSNATVLSCHLLFWFGVASVLADVTLNLIVSEDGRLHLTESMFGMHDKQLAYDQESIIVQRAALHGSGGPPTNWVVCDSFDAIMTASVNAQAATIILACDRTTLKADLMETVYRLRRRNGRNLKIIVREVQVRMRYNEEALIARLGTNLIVPMEVSYARFLSMMEIAQSQIYSGILPATYQQALSEGLPQQQTGYLGPQMFARTVADTLARSRSLAIDNVLVRLTFANGLTALDAMRHCTVKRAGDVYSGDRKTMLVFLFACRDIDATQTLERIFALPIGELFSSEHRYLSNLAATSAIEDFAQRAASGRLPDLSEQMAQILEQRGTDMPPQTAAIPVSKLDSVRRSPKIPSRTPLRLRETALPNGLIDQLPLP